MQLNVTLIFTPEGTKQSCNAKQYTCYKCVLQLSVNKEFRNILKRNVLLIKFYLLLVFNLNAFFYNAEFQLQKQESLQLIVLISNHIIFTFIFPEVNLQHMALKNVLMCCFLTV